MSSEDRAGQPAPELHSGHDREGAEPAGFWRSNTGIVLSGFLLIGGFLLLSEHRLHAFSYLPYLLVLACPLLHLFHHGYGSHGAHKHEWQSGAGEKSRAD
ncbi:DUF2933 domain-containing protein [Sinorhizobium alkalisoli]|uniref:DUF2933 domain-containing protein n=1 Tax=Sinorhizobium alkalisoli TaxID=1752398 RepID=UPI00124BE8DB|nr:DUF2933 domain-containing protein [Sinorhizobium alkalisoli]MCG5480183.1 DUF2933 domain-containing protein [Sinorhizobium alkalisoli]QFI68537.1 hypothetical protein EKH55_3663 [Sinorhizobium alkalisoli]